jgi:superfamily II DNA or RNA helicase
MKKMFFKSFNVLIGDEAHGFKSKSLTSIATKMVDCPYKFGTTGTLDGTTTHRLVLEGLFGPVYKVITTKQLMDEKKISSLSIHCVVLEYEENIRRAYKNLTYQEEILFLISNKKRNKFIKNLAVTQEGNTLVLFQMVAKHGKILHKLITEELKDTNRKIFFVSGETKTKDRELVREITEKENDAIIIASYGTFSTGINIKNLHNIIFASPSKSRIRNLQSIGRGLRKSDVKDHATLYDIADDIHWKKHKNFTLKHFFERIKIYNSEQFDYKIHKVEIR